MSMTANSVNSARSQKMLVKGKNYIPKLKFGSRDADGHEEEIIIVKGDSQGVQNAFRLVLKLIMSMFSYKPESTGQILDYKRQAKNRDDLSQDLIADQIIDDVVEEVS